MPTLKETRYFLLNVFTFFSKLIQKRCKVSKNCTFSPYLFVKKMNIDKKHELKVCIWCKKVVILRRNSLQCAF